MMLGENADGELWRGTCARIHKAYRTLLNSSEATTTGAKPSTAMKTKTPTKAKAEKKDPAKKVGRPGLYCQQMADKICSLMSEGRSLRSIAGKNGIPSPQAIRRWLSEKPEFVAQYKMALDERANHYAEEIVDLADNSTDPAKTRLQIDARKWIACKLLPKKYGDKLDMTTRAETPEVTREDMIAMMRKSPSYLAEIESMVAEAKKPRAEHAG